jgi:hypothetical protein
LDGARVVKILAGIALFVMTALGGLVLSAVVTWFAWQVLISDRAFHCTDDNVSGFWVSMDSHRGAGDSLSPGWTWEKLVRVRTAYEAAFVTLWLTSSSVAYWAVFRRMQRGANERIIQQTA